MAGVFDDLELNRAKIFDSAPNLLMISQTINRDMKSDQKNLFYNRPDEKEFYQLLKNSKPWATNILFLNEYNALSFFTSGSPLKKEYKLFKNFKLSSSKDIATNRINGKTFEVLGFLVKYEERIINNSKFLDLYFIDDKGTFNVSLFKEKLEEFGIILKEGFSYISIVTHSLDRENRMRLRLKDLKDCKRLIKQNVKESKIYLKDSSGLNDLKDLLKLCDKGNTRVILVCNKKEIHSGFLINYDEDIFSKIKYLSSIEQIEKIF